MKALLLAAGSGTRLRPETDDRPKPMVDIQGEPAIAHSLRWLKRQGVRDVAINLSYFPDVLKAFVQDGSRFGLSVRYSVEPEPLGTAGALVPLRAYFEGSGDFLVLYGDVLTDLEIGPMLHMHQSTASDMTIAVNRTLDPTSAGIIGFGADGRIDRFVEKPKAEDVFSDWENGGVYLCGQGVLAYANGPSPRDFGHDVIPALLRDGKRLQAWQSGAAFLDYGTPMRLANARKWVGRDASTAGANPN